MSKTTLVDDLDVSELGMQYEETPLKSKSKKVTGIARPRPATPKKVKVTNMSKDEFKKAKSAHKAAIAKIKLNRKQEKQDIKRHKMLIKQAKLTYKLTQMKASK